MIHKALTFLGLDTFINLTFKIFSGFRWPLHAQKEHILGKRNEIKEQNKIFLTKTYSNVKQGVEQIKKFQCK